MGKSKYAPFQQMILNGEVPPKKIAEFISDGCTADHVRSAKQRFMYPQKCHEDKTRWRKNNPDKIRETRKKYRNPSREFAVSNGTSYTDAEDYAILLGDKTTRELAKELGRSIDGIYRRRVRLRKGVS